MTRTSSSAIRAAEAAALAAATDPSPTIYPQDARVDNGHLVPLSNIYPNAPQDWMHDAVQRLIVERKLAPFYRGLDDWEPPDDDDDFDRDALDQELDKVGDEQSRNWRTSTYSKQDRLDEAMMYKKASECPICFLYYPPLINTSRCCDQPICTECFVQIKRADPTTTNLISEPAACPYCVETNFGVTYIPPAPARRTGLGAPKNANPPELTRSASTDSSEVEMGPAAAAHARRKSLSHTASEVVTVDAIQQDWELKLASVQATAARRAARRVVFRQVGERLVPVGISSGRELNPNTTTIDDQGRIILTGPVPILGQGGRMSATVEAGPGGSGSGSSRLLAGSRGRQSRGLSMGQSDSAEHAARMMGMGPDLEELMVMEAMRLSMLDEEERRKKDEKEAKAKAKKSKKEAASSSASPGSPSAGASGSGSGSTGGGAAKRLFSAVKGASGSSASSANDRGEGTSGSGGSILRGGGSGRASPRASLDVPSRASSDSSRTASAVAPPGSGSVEASTSASASTSTAPPTFAAATQPQSNNPYSRYGGTTKSSFLKMPPMQRNDSSASMSQHNLPAPLVPAKPSSPPSGSANRNAPAFDPKANDDLLL